MIDLFLIVLLVWAAFSGWRSGFLREVTSMVGLLVGLLIAATCYGAFGKYLAVDGSETNMVTSIIAFFLLWIVVPIVLGFFATMLTKVIKGMQLGVPNSILGLVVSVVKYLVLVSCVLNVMDGLGIMNHEKTADSRLYGPVTGALRVFFPADTTAVSPDGGDAAKGDTVWVNVGHTPRTADSTATAR